MSKAEAIRSRALVKSPQQKSGAKAPASFFGPVIQPRLTINQPHDPYEQEADAMADKVMRMTDHETLQAKPSPVTIQKKCADCEAEEKLQMKEEDEEKKVQKSPVAGLPLQKKCADCEAEEKLMLKCASCEEEEGVHRKESGSAATHAATPSVYQTIQSSGRPLNTDTRSFMESRFNQDFNEVQIHDDPLAHRSAKEINARAYTHGQHIVFGSGEYQPHTHSGKELLAHELTHVVQQNSAAKSIQTQGKIQRAPGGYKMKNTLIPRKRIDIRGKTELQLGSEFNDYVLGFFSQGIYEIPITIAFGSQGEGTVYFRPKRLGFSEQCEIIYFPAAPIPIVWEECGMYYDIRLSTFDAVKQVIPFTLDGLDTSDHSGTLSLNVEVKNNKIVSNGGDEGSDLSVGWVAGKTKGTLSSYDKADTRREAFLPFIYGKDYDGKNFWGSMYNNNLYGGFLTFNSVGGLTLPNRQSIFGLIQLGDVNNWSHHTFDTDIVGAEDYEFVINRTDKGELTGEGEGLKFDGSWTGMGFEAKGAIRASFVNSNLMIEGSASFESKSRGLSGSLMVIVTDYTTAKRFAIDYLPEDIASKSKTDKPPNPDDQLAFAGAGNLSFTLFDGKKNLHPKKALPKTIVGDPPPPQDDLALQADASFVVEPEGYITIAGQVRTRQKEFVLFKRPKDDYKKTIPVINFTVFSIPGPLFTNASLVFKVDLEYGAFIGPCTLSDIVADGRYSSRPDSPTELELSALIQMTGGIFLSLKACFDLEGSILGLFEKTFVEWCPLEVSLRAAGVVQARPTIKIVSPAADPDRTTPPEYFIQGSFNLDIAGELALQIGDSLTINITEKDKKDKDKDKTKDKDVPKKYRYKRNKKTVKNKYGSKDVEIPMDHSLGSEEIPRVSLSNFLRDNLEEKFNKLISQDRPKTREHEDDYFGEGEDRVPPQKTVEDKNLDEGGYDEGGELQEGIVGTPTNPPAEQPAHVFEEEFTMNGAPHKLSLRVEQVNNKGNISFEAVLMMESEAEPVAEKIEEEKQDIKDHPDRLSEFRKKDLAEIEFRAERIKKEAKELGENDELSNAPRVPALRPLASSIQNFGSRYGKKDFGIPDNTLAPLCDEPLDAENGKEITFTKYQGHTNKGRILGRAVYRSPDGKFSQWTIQYKPYGSRKGTMAAPPAYDDKCHPLYFITKPENCADFKSEHRVLYVGERTTSQGIKIPERTKASWVKAWPLCWTTYQEPTAPLVGLDRIKEGRTNKWHRAHLIHGNMGGPGDYWNLMPVLKTINNDYMPDIYEKTLKNIVRNGFGTGKFFWFEAKVTYQDDYHPVIGHHNDFPKGMTVKFGEVEKDIDGNWKFLPPLTDMTLDFGSILRDELNPSRVRG